MNNPNTITIPAIDPCRSASVSAGTGKTWLLVSRLVRLLLQGADPEGILAITFTRKAAAEMQQRLSQRLLQLATAGDRELDTLLRQIDAPLNQQTVAYARRLYERLLHAPRNIQITTFHAFCQDILRRFPLEANVPPGFELLEHAAELQQAAWDLLFSEATAQPDSQLSRDLDTLFEHCGTVFSTRNALENFLHHRSDWWAYNENNDTSLKNALKRLEEFFAVDTASDPITQLFNASLINDARRFAALLLTHDNPTNKKYAACIEKALQLRETQQSHEAFAIFREAFLTKDNTLRVRKYSKTLEKSLGATGIEEYLQLHSSIGEQLLQAIDQAARVKSLHLNMTWYRVGSRLLEHYQLLKREQRMLDFTDLEWKAYQLLNLAEHAHWVQYKLDARINHLLIDEFQDTNPTQWQLLTPLLAELASGQDDRQRSAFIVGDTKQSIYRFRRADPQLFQTAQHWLDQHLEAINQPLDKSWRSSPAIIDTVNTVFSHAELQAGMPGFTTHTTHHQDLWGHVEVLPLVATEVGAADNETGCVERTLRNPLHEPRLLDDDVRHYREGQLIAHKILQLINDETCVGSGADVLPLNYNHIMILLRHRTHAHAYEQALRELAIPYAGAERGTLLETLEIRDMLALLEILITPYNDLSLAHVLRSPVFDCRNDDLINLALCPQGNWMERLRQLGQGGDNPTLAYACDRLTGWQSLAGILPVHDLLDRIFTEGNILERYQAAFPPHLAQRVKANLIRFLELALEVDSGRYPSIGRFLLRLQTLRDQAEQSPDETPANLKDAHVRILTIHASKGLEAPVVFLADTTNTIQKPRANQTIVHWPADQQRPQNFILAGKKSEQDSCTQRLVTLDQQAERRENANLLYVAMTRARQCLFITGCKPNRGTDTGWYGLIRQQLTEGGDEDQQSIEIEYGTRPQAAPAETRSTPAKTAVEVDPRLTHPFVFSNESEDISPSSQIHVLPAGGNTEAKPAAADEDSQLRGRLIHRMLQLLSDGYATEDVAQQTQSEYGLASDDALLQRCMREAEGVFRHPDTRLLFEPKTYLEAHNEVPIHYSSAGRDVFGIIDRLVVHKDYIAVIDYKTHATDNPDMQRRLLQSYGPQLTLYSTGITKLWPGKPVRPMILFTHNIRLEKL